MSKRRAAWSLCITCLLPAAATAAATTVDEITTLRRELAETRALVDKLESRLAAVEAEAAPATAADEQVEPVAGSPVATSPNAFNPAISVVLQGSYNAYSRAPGDMVFAGFPPAEEASLPNEGFSLGESEVNLSASIDQVFYGSITLALEDDAGDTEANVEEAFIETLALPWGTKIKAGRMYPVLGYLNEIHPHADDFVDRPLPYRAFLGGGNYADDGVQLSVLLPTDLYAEIGGGAFRGNGYPAAGSSNDGNGSQSLFARLGGDVGVAHSWLAGIAYLRAEATDRDTDGLVFNGKAPVWIADAKYTWAPGGNLANRSLVLQGEYFRGDADGSYDDLPYDESADGWYAQAVYRFARQWKAGYRYAYLGAPDVPPDFAGTALDSGGHNPRTQSLLLEREFSEFSSLRLQYTRDDSLPEASDEAVLRYTISMGAHGAHKY